MRKTFATRFKKKCCQFVIGTGSYSRVGGMRVSEGRGLWFYWGGMPNVAEGIITQARATLLSKCFMR